jgi:hypothetical protein
MNWTLETPLSGVSFFGSFVNKLKTIWRIKRTTEETRTFDTDKIG